jgi:hypothetical protein
MQCKATKPPTRCGSPIDPAILRPAPSLVNWF